MKRRLLHSYLRRAANTALATRDYAFPRPKTASSPFLFHIEFNDYCNLHCVHCARENSEIEKNTGQWSMEMLERIAPWLPWAGFVGIAGLGEPFVTPHLPQFLERIIELGPCPSIITNGTLIDNEKADRLAGMGPMLLNFSIDGATPKTFESIRRGARLEQVIECMDAIRQAKNRKQTPYPLVFIYWCFLKENLGEAEELAALAARARVDGIQVQPVYDYGQPGAEKKQNLSDDEFNAAVARLRSAAEKRGVPLTSAPITQAACKGVQGRLFCPNLWKTIHFDPRGNVRVCCMGGFESVGNIMEQPLDKIWNSEPMRQMRASLLQGNPPPACRKCYLLEPYHRRTAMAQLQNHLSCLKTNSLFS